MDNLTIGIAIVLISVIGAMGWIFLILSLRNIIELQSKHKRELWESNRLSTSYQDTINGLTSRIRIISQSADNWRESCKLTEKNIQDLKDKIRDVMNGRKKSFSFEGRRFRLCARKINARKIKKKKRNKK